MTTTLKQQARLVKGHFSEGNAQRYKPRVSKEVWATAAWKYFNTSSIYKSGTSKFSKNIPKSKFNSCYEPYFKIVVKIQNVPIQISDHHFSLPVSLNHIAGAISKSQAILSLDNDWDDDGADATNLSTYLKAINFVVNYSKFIFESLRVVIDYPDIDILRDGSIGVFWETKKATFLIIFKKNVNRYSYLFGNNKIDGIPFKYAIDNQGIIDEITAKWMSQNLK